MNWQINWITRILKRLHTNKEVNHTISSWCVSNVMHYVLHMRVFVGFLCTYIGLLHACKIFKKVVITRVDISHIKYIFKFILKVLKRFNWVPRTKKHWNLVLTFLKTSLVKYKYISRLLLSPAVSFFLVATFGHVTILHIFFPFFRGLFDNRFVRNAIA